ncbi:MAG: MAPEG family protein, partial [Marinicellaceae bacterium]
VQMNTLETLVVFLPALYLASKYWSSLLVAGIGFVYIIGRFIYWRAYVTKPASRGLGFVLSILPAFVLIVLTVVGIVMSLLGL